MRAVGRVVLRLIVPIVIGVIWWFGSAGSKSPYFPPLSTILATFRRTWLFADVKTDLIPSLERMMIGYALAIIFGVGLGMLFGRIEILRRACDNLIQFGRSVPGTALVPIGIVVIGIGNTTKIIIISFVCLFPILLNTIDGVHSVERLQVDVARVYQLRRRQTLFRVILPASAPQAFVGMRIALAVAFVMMIITEMVAATNGIGYVTLSAEEQLQIPQMWAGMILLGILGYLFNLLFVGVERRIMGWHMRQSGLGREANGG